MQVTRIIAVRHGETDWNLATRLQGHTDIALNTKGRWQAQRVAQALAQEHIAAIYSSDLQRALHTAQAIAQPHSLPVHTEVGLRERGFGTFEGYTYAEIEANWPEDSRRWRQRDPHFAPAGGETSTQVLARVAETVALLARRHLGGQLLLVAHGGVLDMLYRLATQQPLHAARTWELGNTAINRLLWTPEGLSLVGWADEQHLDNAPAELPEA